MRGHPLLTSELQSLHQFAANCVSIMQSQLLRISRSSLARLARQQHVNVSRRTFIAVPARQAELVQDMYLRELKAYKQPAVKASDSEGHVQKFAMPKAPPSPEEGDIASELKAYESQQVEVEGQSGPADGEASAASVSEDWFEDDQAEDETASAHH